MGFFQPGGANTQVFIYDDADATGGHAAGSPHTIAELNAFDALVCSKLQDPAGNTFSGARTQYLLTKNVQLGRSAVGQNLTSLVDKDLDLFVKSGNFTFDSNSTSTITFIMGTKVGLSPHFAGVRGCGLNFASTPIFRGTVGLYGCMIEAVGSIQFANTGAAYQELAGCLCLATAPYILGNSANFRYYHTVFTYPGTGNMVTSALVDTGHDSVLAGAAPGAFIASAAPSRSFRGLDLAGVPTVADLVMNPGAQKWVADEINFSNQAPKRVSINTNGLGNGLRYVWRFDTKVVDQNGNPLQAVPIQLSTDVDGLILDTQTGLDGNVVFNADPLGSVLTNRLVVREDYTLDNGTTVLTKDRLFTIVVNGFGGAFPPLANYETQTYNFEYPGRDQISGGYQVDGGLFEETVDVIPLRNGQPTHGTATGWVELTL